MDTLMNVVLPIVVNDKCREDFDTTLDEEGQICAGGVEGKVEATQAFVE